MNALPEMSALLKSVENLNADALRKIANLLSTKETDAIVGKYLNSAKDKNVDLSFNLFALVSDHYYRETFHSDILFALLNPVSSHLERDKYLKLFLEFLRTKPNGRDLNPDDYVNAEVTEEQGKIDILIKGSSKAIIIENKIFDAIDQPRQLPIYLSRVRDELRCQCDAIVYLRLNKEKCPSRDDWSPEEKVEIDSKLIFIMAADDTSGDLLHGWIRPCQEKAENVDALLILRQYGALLQELGKNVMNKIMMEQFIL